MTPAAKSQAPTTASAGRLRLRWFAGAVPAFTIGWSGAQAMGEVVGEAWGGDVLHLFGHAIGTVVVVALVALAAWLALRHQVAWAGRWAVASTAGAVVGVALYLPILMASRDALTELIIALTLYLPLLTTALFQIAALRHRVPRRARWSLAWSFGLFLGAGAWYAGGGFDFASAASVHPVFQMAAAYWWAMIPRSMLGALFYATWTALTVPLDPSPAP